MFPKTKSVRAAEYVQQCPPSIFRGKPEQIEAMTYYSAGSLVQIRTHRASGDLHLSPTFRVRSCYASIYGTRVVVERTGDDGEVWVCELPTLNLVKVAELTIRNAPPKTGVEVVTVKLDDETYPTIEEIKGYFAEYVQSYTVRETYFGGEDGGASVVGTEEETAPTWAEKMASRRAKS